MDLCIQGLSNSKISKDAIQHAQKDRLKNKYQKKIKSAQTSCIEVLVIQHVRLNCIGGFVPDQKSLGYKNKVMI